MLNPPQLCKEPTAGRNLSFSKDEAAPRRRNLDVAGPGLLLAEQDSL